MEIIFTIPNELEYFERLVKLAKIKRNEMLQLDHVATIALTIFSLKRISINKNCSKIIHLMVEMNNHIIEGLVDTRASMLVIVTSVVRELSIVHLVIRLKSYKKASGVVT
jgi:pentose-5-phosphate-3-epimerase